MAENQLEEQIIKFLEQGSNNLSSGKLKQGISNYKDGTTFLIQLCLW